MSVQPKHQFSVLNIDRLVDALIKFIVIKIKKGLNIVRYSLSKTKLYSLIICLVSYIKLRNISSTVLDFGFLVIMKKLIQCVIHLPCLFI